MKDVSSCDKPRLVARKLRPGDLRMRHLIRPNSLMLPYRKWGSGNVLKRSIIVSIVKENNSDSVISGERTRNRSNRIPIRNYREMWSVDSFIIPKQLSWSVLESSAREGDGPVNVNCMVRMNSRVARDGISAWMCQIQIGKPKYKQRPIAQ